MLLKIGKLLDEKCTIQTNSMFLLAFDLIILCTANILFTKVYIIYEQNISFVLILLFK